MADFENLKTPVIELRGITKTYFAGEENELNANENISLTINEGELVAIVGQSGSGKSTLMNIIGALDRPTSGVYLLDSKAVEKLDDNELSEIRNEKIGFVFQTFNLLPKLTALENVEVPLFYASVSKAKRTERALEMLKLVGMDERAKHYPNELSGGQKQRVAIARALAMNPKIILADEPTGALDSKTSEMVLELMLELHKSQGTTVIIITHSLDVAKVCERQITVQDGKIIEDKQNA